MVNFNYFLQRKYALLKQQADAGTANAQSNAVASNAAAGLDRTRANLLPKQTAAEIAQSGAQTNLLREQASIVRPESTARIANLGAETERTRVNTIGDFNTRVQTFAPNQGSLGRVLGQRGLPSIGSGSIFRLSSGGTGDERRRPGESEAAWLDRINGF